MQGSAITYVMIRRLSRKCVAAGRRDRSREARAYHRAAEHAAPVRARAGDGSVAGAGSLGPAVGSAVSRRAGPIDGSGGAVPSGCAVGPDEAHRRDHALLPVAGDVAADEPAVGGGRGVRRHRPGDVDPLPGPDDDPDAVEAGRRRDIRRRARRRADHRLLGRLPRQLVVERPEDRLVLLEAAVDHVQEDGLAGREVDDRRHERVVARHDVDLARDAAGPGRDRRRAGRRARVAGGHGDDEDAGDGGMAERGVHPVMMRETAPDTAGRKSLDTAARRHLACAPLRAADGTGNAGARHPDPRVRDELETATPRDDAPRRFEHRRAA